jgi:hypothetical protein
MIFGSVRTYCGAGLVASNVGGTFIQLWSSGDALAACSSKTDSLLQVSPPTGTAAAAVPRGGKKQLLLPQNTEFRAEAGILEGGALWNTMIVPLLPMVREVIQQSLSQYQNIRTALTLFCCPGIPRNNMV